MQQILDILQIFFSHPCFNIIGGISTLLAISVVFTGIFLAIKGCLPVWYRLGIGLTRTEIAIFASSQFENLKGMLIDSKIFREKNLLRINDNDLKKAEGKAIFLVHWKDYQKHLEEILLIKKDSTTLIVYAPQEEGFIDSESMKIINHQRNTIIVNFRGRLLNDIFVSLMTTSCKGNI